RREARDVGGAHTGARFCHRCGTPAGAAAAPDAAPRGVTGALPWAVAGIALLALLALVAGQRFGRTPDGTAPAAVGAGLPPADAGAGMGPGVRAPDISSLSPRERADRLFNRIMAYHERGLADSVQFFAPMALAAYQQAAPLDADQRYHFGRIGEVTGVAELARAQADTILRESPRHLLGLILAARAARMRGDEAAARDFDARLRVAAPSERGRAPEYAQHQNDIDAALAASPR
ncbi:MAG TPA: hypothetical protein VNA89_03635, partial [Gemmatimonadaceae bacterium]|nr:hypothetical protein [Gemmatimonadaceae bacterium]